MQLRLRSVTGYARRRRLVCAVNLPLTITSTNKMVKRLGGKRWAALHRLVYLSAIAGVVHFWMLVKSDIRLPLTFAFVLLFLLGYRLLAKYAPAPQPGANLFPRE